MADAFVTQPPKNPMFYQQQPMILMGPRQAKRRPATAGRRAQFTFGEKKGGLGNQPLTTKAASLIDLEVSKLRPRIVQQERERLYDDVMRQRLTTNNLKDENTRLKTKLQIVEVELQRKDKLIDELIVQQEASYGVTQAKFGGRAPGTFKTDTHLVINLKR